MNRPGLIYKDGYESSTPWMRSEVRLLQQALNDAGAALKVDGYYGDKCRDAVGDFQSKNGLAVTGEVDSATWSALEAHIGNVTAFSARMTANLMPGFRGDLYWIHLMEGHRGRSYWPGGKSGVTLDPGVDLAYTDYDHLRKLYGGSLEESQYKAMKKAYGVYGEAARELLARDQVLQGIRVNREKADEIMPFAIKPYWHEIVQVFPVLAEADVFPAVQTVLLSLAYNRGPRNEGLTHLGEPLATRRWAQVGELVATMQQDHPLEGIRKRRAWEGALILTHLQRLG